MSVADEQVFALNVNVASIYGAHTRQALVTIQVGDRKPLMIPPDAARELATSLIQCAEAAEQDATLMTFAQDALGLPVEEAGRMLLALRDWRESRRPTGEEGT